MKEEWVNLVGETKERRDEKSGKQTTEEGERERD